MLLSACGSGGGGGSPVPTVAETTPPNQATNVPVNSDIRAKFASSVDPVTVNDKTFFVIDAAGPIAGTVTYQDRKAIFTPSAPFGKGKQYSAVLTTGVKDLDGVPLPSNVTWSFVTEGVAEQDTTPPKIEAKVPEDKDSNVSNTAPIIVVFSEAIDPKTINPNTFFIKGVTGTYTYDEPTRTAKLVPSAPLALSTTYAVTVTTGIKDLAGNALAEGATWSFKTVAAVDVTPPQIVSKSPAENANAVPVNSNITVSFDEQVDPSTLQSRFVLTGPSGDVQTNFSYNVGSKLATLDPVSDLAGETTYQVFVKKGVEDISGNATSSDTSWFFTTAKGLDTTPPLPVKETPKNEDIFANGVFVKSLIRVTFSEPINADTLTDHFIVSAKNGNLSGQITYEDASMTATFTPAGGQLDYSTTYTVVLDSGIKDLAGNSLVKDSWSFTTIDAPQVIDKSPSGQGISTDPPPPIQATFSREMKGASLDSRSFYVFIGADPSTGRMVPGSISYANAVATFTPTVPYLDNTTYGVTLATAVVDINGNPLPANVTWTFQTAAPPDPPPSVVSTAPADGAIGVSVNISTISAQFARSIDSSSLTGQFTVRDANGNALAGRPDYDVAQQQAIFLLSQGSLAYNTSYTATLGAGVRSSSGTPMGTDYVWTFTTEAAPDTTPPSVVRTDPADGAQGVSTTDPSGHPFSIRVDFSEPVAPGTVNSGTFTVVKVESDLNKPQFSGTYRFDGSSAFFVPSSFYEPGKTYQVTLSTGITDLTGNHLPSDVVFSFTTAP